MEKGFELAAIQVSPDAFGGMIARGAGEGAFGARPRHSGRMACPDVHTPIFKVELDSVDRPRFGQCEEVLIEFYVLHNGADPLENP